MTVSIHHALPGRIRIHYDMGEVTSRQAILAQSLIAVQEGITDISVNTKIGSYLVYFNPSVISQNQIENLFKALGAKYLEDYFFKKCLPLPLRKILLFYKPHQISL